MSQRNYSVIVTPDAWTASLDELARVVAPMTSVRAKQLVPVLERGPMTLDADLSLEEAGRLLDRLDAAQVPGQVVDDDGHVVEKTRADKDADDVDEASEPEVEEPEFELEEIGSGSDDVDSEEPEGGWSSFLGDADVEDVHVDVDDSLDADSTPGDSSLVVEQETGRENTPTLDELESGGARSKREPGSTTQLGAPGPSKPEHTEDDAPSEKLGPKLPSSAESPDPKDASKGETTRPMGLSSDPPPQIPSRGPDGEGAAELESRAETTRPMGSMSESGFDASRLNAALDPDSDRPPYAPEGFDDRAEHIPALAAFLSLVAPGAGQTYNGEPEKSWDFGTRFALLLPWYRSVRQAWERAEQIRTYYAPHPRDGALGRAVKYAVSWWVIVAGVVALLGFGGYAAYDTLTRPERPKVTEADIRSAHDEARRQIGLARIAGLDGVSNYLDERDSAGKRFTMSKEERVERGFRRGYEACKAREYDTCAALMKKVADLSPKYRREAYKLQAWASVQRDAASDEQPIPEIDIGSLESFETGESPGLDETTPQPAVDRDPDAGAEPADASAAPDAASTAPNNPSEEVP
jgi:hypothetical protein